MITSIIRGLAKRWWPSEAINYRPHPIGFSFAPGGLLMPYHLGVLAFLRHVGYISAKTPLAGSSAGALAVACTAVDYPIEDTMQAIFRLEDQVRTHGARAKLKEPLAKALDELLPQDAHDVLNTRPGAVYVTYSTWRQKHMVDRFYSRKDLIECIVASCNIPFYLSSSAMVNCRGARAMDGYFADPYNFGCPDIPGVRRHIRVMPFAHQQVASHLKGPDVISPGLALMDEYIPEKIFDWFERVYLESYPSLPRDLKRQSHERPSVAPFDINKRLKLALSAAEDDSRIVELFNSGRRDALRWFCCNAMAKRGKFTMVDR